MASWTADKFRHCLETRDFESLATLYGPAAIFDCTVGPWRFQRQGVDAIVAQYREDYAGPATIDRWQERSTPWGAVIEVEASQIDEGGETFFRWVQLLTVEDGLIVEDTTYCSGPWDEATRERWRREAPMVRA